MEITNADRVVFPDDGITKGDVAGHYARVADLMLPFMRERALTVERFPRGIGGEGFMQKNAPNHYPKDLIRRHSVGREDGGETIYPVVDSTEGIAFFANSDYPSIVTAGADGQAILWPSVDWSEQPMDVLGRR